MDILSLYESKVDDIWFRRETRFDALYDFSEVHMKILRNENHSKVDVAELEKYCSERNRYRKDMIDLQLSMRCCIDLNKKYDALQRNLKKRKRPGTDRSEDDSRAERLAANGFSVAALRFFNSASNKRKRLLEFQSHYNSLLEQVDKNVEEIEAKYPDMTVSGDAVIALPLHDTGITLPTGAGLLWNGSGSVSISSPGSHVQLRRTNTVQAERMDALAQLQVLYRLQRNLQGSLQLLKTAFSTAFSQLGEAEAYVLQERQESKI